MKTPHAPLTLLALTFALGVSSAHAADWPNYRGPRHNGISTEKLTVAAWPAAGPQAEWRTPTPGGFSSIVIADQRAYTLVTREFEGVKRETLVALDATSGKELWVTPLSTVKYDGGGDAGAGENKGGDGARSTPTVNDGQVYVLDAKLLLVCVNAQSGKETWRKDLVAEHAGRNISWQNAASPVIDGDLVFVAGGGEGQALLGIDKRTGKTVWKGQDDKMTHATPVVAELLGQKQVIFFTQSGLVAVHPATGAVLWRQAYRYNISTAASPVVCGPDLVYCSAGYGVGAGLYRISKNGDTYQSTEVWRQTGKLQNHWSTPVFHDGHLYGLFGFKEYGSCPLKCIELATGTEKWSSEGFGPGNVTLVDGHLIVLGDAGQLVLAEATPTAFKESARADVLAGKCWTTPTYAGGKVYARSTQEAVCIDLTRKLATR
ncbi:MAG: PQQ-like beta-propeller repeat protein [Verrucomicrobiales bacterium]|nr:PQQ-like beta-propeller repeat protein [Verrucomicrobiales bacterium]